MVDILLFITFVDIFAPKHISFVELVTVMRMNASLLNACYLFNVPSWTLKNQN